MLDSPKTEITLTILLQSPHNGHLSTKTTLKFSQGSRRWQRFDCTKTYKKFFERIFVTVYKYENLESLHTILSQLVLPQFL